MEAGLIERALQIAPECASIIEVKRRLIREGYEQLNAQLSSRPSDQARDHRSPEPALERYRAQEPSRLGSLGAPTPVAPLRTAAAGLSLSRD